MRTLVALVALVGAGCTSTRSCKKGTILVSVTYGDGTKAADNVVVSVAVDNGDPKESPLAHTANTSRGTIEIDFDSYPTGRRVTVVIEAFSGQSLLGGGSNSVVLTDSCGVLSVAVSEGFGALDMSTASDGGVDASLPNDATPSDGSASLQDLKSSDLDSDLMLPGVATARLIAPLSTSTVTQQRPTLRWTLGLGAGTPAVDLCSDRNCNNPLPGVTATVAGDNLSAKPSAMLPTGWIYWRVRVVNGTQSSASATWQFWVGKQVASTSVDRGNGTILDINGDGHADFLVGASVAGSNVGAAYLYVGNSSGSGFQRLDLTDPDGSNASFGFSVASAGDVNGDGFGDFLISAGSAGGSGGAVHLYLGGSTPSLADWNGATAPKRIDLTNPDGAGAVFGSSVASAGDINGDGFADFVVAASNTSSNTGAAHVYFGDAVPNTSAWNSGAFPNRIDLTTPDGAGGFFGSSVAGAGDVDGDGYSDFLVGASGTSSNAGAAHLYRGEAMPTPTDWNTGSPPSMRIDLATDGAGAFFGHSVAPAGDVNGDGYSDFLVSATGAGIAHCYLGEATLVAAHWNTGAPPTKRIDLTNPDGASANFGDSIAGVGDVDGDGYADFLIGASGASTNTGAAHLYLGEASPAQADWNSGAPPPKRLDLTSPDGGGSNFGRSVSGAGDISGDGYFDFIVAAPLASSAAGTIHLYSGESTPALADWNTGSPPPKRLDITSPGGANGHFGGSVASITNDRRWGPMRKRTTRKNRAWANLAHKEPRTTAKGDL